MQQGTAWHLKPCGPWLALLIADLTGNRPLKKQRPIPSRPTHLRGARHRCKSTLLPCPALQPAAPRRRARPCQASARGPPAGRGGRGGWSSIAQPPAEPTVAAHGSMHLHMEVRQAKQQTSRSCSAITAGGTRLEGCNISLHERPCRRAHGKRCHIIVLHRDGMDARPAQALASAHLNERPAGHAGRAALPLAQAPPPCSTACLRHRRQLLLPWPVVQPSIHAVAV